MAIKRKVEPNYDRLPGGTSWEKGWRPTSPSGTTNQSDPLRPYQEKNNTNGSGVNGSGANGSGGGRHSSASGTYYPHTDYSGVEAFLNQQHQADIDRQNAYAAQRQAAAQSAHDKNMEMLNNLYAQRGEGTKKIYDDTLAWLQQQHDYGAGNINTAADNAQQEAYIEYMMRKRDMPQMLQAQGITGGATESTIGDMGNAYGNNRNRIDTGRNTDLAALAQTLLGKQNEARSRYDQQVLDDAAKKAAYQMQIEQAFANLEANILADQFKGLSGIENAYTQAMAGLKKGMIDANARQRSYSVDAEDTTETTGNTDNPTNSGGGSISDKALATFSATPYGRHLLSTLNFYEDPSGRIQEAYQNGSITLEQADNLLGALGYPAY